MARKLELNITYKCNSHCPECDRMIDRAPLGAADASDVQVAQLCDYLRRLEMHWAVIKLAGGEPTIHPRFSRIVRLLSDLQPEVTDRVVVYTNGLRSVQVPPNVEMAVSAPGHKDHALFCVSPSDLLVHGHYGTLRRCPQTGVCGVGFDAHGFTPCPLASVVGRVAGVNPYSSRLVRHGSADYCRHCIHSLPRAFKGFIRRLARRGAIPYPTPTYAAAIKRFRSGGESLPLWSLEQRP